MRKLITIALIAVGITVSAKTKQEDPSESKCKQTYKHIRYLLDEGLITSSEAQQMWLNHKNNER